MVKGKLEFDLPEDKDKFKASLNGIEIVQFLHELDQELEDFKEGDSSSLFYGEEISNTYYLVWAVRRKISKYLY